MRTLFVDEQLKAGPLSLHGDEAHHARSVLRLSAGDRCRLVDGIGHDAEAEVVAIKRHELDVSVADVMHRNPPAGKLLTVALAAPKGGRLDDVVWPC